MMYNFINPYIETELPSDENPYVKTGEQLPELW